MNARGGQVKSALSVAMTLTIFPAFAATTTYAASETGGCHKPELIGTSISPGRRWTARIERQYCSDGWLVSNLVDIVSVAPISAPAQTAAVLGIDDDGHDDDRPSLSWPGPNTLRIEVVGFAGVGSHRDRLGALSIILRKRSEASAASLPPISQKSAKPLESLSSAQVAPATLASGNVAPDADHAQIHALMQQANRQLQQLHQQTRTQMLTALTPAHRTLVANVIGQLAIAPNANPQAATQQLDTVLSGGEKQAIVNLDAGWKASVHHVIQAERARFQSTLTAEQRTFMSILESHVHVAEPTQPPSFDPGAILFQTLTAGWHGIHDPRYG